MTRLEPNATELHRFIGALFSRVGSDGFVSLRTFRHGENVAERVLPVSLVGGLDFLLECAVDEASRAANNPKPCVFAPPIAVFNNNKHAGEADLLLGPVLSVECDSDFAAAKVTLERLLGPVTLAVESGGIDQAGLPKGHLHWRGASPASGVVGLANLKQARIWAAQIVGADPTNNTIVHPLRWPGSWHRKGEPKLCRISEFNDTEIDFATASEALREAIVARGIKVAGPCKATSTAEWKELLGGQLGEGQRHPTLVKLTGHLLRRGVDPHIVLFALQAINQVHCSPPKSEQEVFDIVDWCLGREMARREGNF